MLHIWVSVNIQCHIIICIICIEHIFHMLSQMPVRQSQIQCHACLSAHESMSFRTGIILATSLWIATDKTSVGAFSHILSTGHHILPVYNWRGQRVTDVWCLRSTSARGHRQHHLVAISIVLDLDAFLVEQVDATSEARVGRTPAIRVIDSFSSWIASYGIVFVPFWYATPRRCMGRRREDEGSCQYKRWVRRPWCHGSLFWVVLTAPNYFQLFNCKVIGGTTSRRLDGKCPTNDPMSRWRAILEPPLYTYMYPSAHSKNPASLLPVLTA